MKKSISLSIFIFLFVTVFSVTSYSATVHTRSTTFSLDSFVVDPSAICWQPATNSPSVFDSVHYTPLGTPFNVVMFDAWNTSEFDVDDNSFSYGGTTSYYNKKVNFELPDFDDPWDGLTNQNYYYYFVIPLHFGYDSADEFFINSVASSFTSEINLHLAFINRTGSHTTSQPFRVDSVELIAIPYGHTLGYISNDYKYRNKIEDSIVNCVVDYVVNESTVAKHVANASYGDSLQWSFNHWQFDGNSLIPGEYCYYVLNIKFYGTPYRYPQYSMYMSDSGGTKGMIYLTTFNGYDTYNNFKVDLDDAGSQLQSLVDNLTNGVTSLKSAFRVGNDIFSMFLTNRYVSIILLVVTALGMIAIFL